ncbi:hypothetical protein D3C81_1364660 [compost metagenome]
MKVLVKYTPAMPRVLAPMHSSSGRQAVRSTSITGACSLPLVLLACSRLARNAGDSLTPRRIARPTSSNSALARNGKRQPQLMRSSSGKRVTALKANNDRIKPAGLPSWANEAKKFRRPLGACSPAINTAPPHSPPTAMPWTIRSRISNTGAAAPI